MSKKGGLGKGIGVLFGEETTTLIEKEIEAKPEEKDILVAVDKIDPNPYQPRKTFDKEKLEELAASIKQYGVVQPLIVRAVGKRFQLVAGERRLRASKIAGLAEVPVIVREFTDERTMEIALIENIQRNDLNAVEEAQGLRRLMQECKLTQEQVAEKVGRSRAAVANLLRLLNLAQKIQEYIIEGKMNMGQAKQLAGLAENIQLELADKIIEQSWSSRTTEEVIRLVKAGKKYYVDANVVKEVVVGEKKSVKNKAANKDVFSHDLEGRLREMLGTKVKVQPKDGKQGGTIQIEYYSEDDLKRIYELLEGSKKQTATAFSTPIKLNV